MESMVASINISSMSKKVSDEFKGDAPTMTAYFTPETDEDREALKAFGIREYTPKDGGENFFIAKVTAKLMLYKGTDDKHEKPVELSGLVADGTGFKFAEGEFHKVNFISGEKSGQKFQRIQAILAPQSSDLEKIEANNPFALD